MNKKLAYILVLGLLIGLVGCAKPVITPTDFTQTDLTFSQTDEQEEGDQNHAVSETVTQQAETKEPQQTTKQPSSSEPSKQKTSQPTQSSNSQPTQSSNSQPSVTNNDGYMADVWIEHPTFTTEAALQSWLKGNNTEYFADDRTQMMGTLATKSTVTYRRPAIAANTAQSGYKLERISTYPSGNAIYFHYRSTTNPEEVLNVLPQNDGLYNPAIEMYEISVNNVAQNKEWNYSSVVDGITFYYKYIPSSKMLSIVWEQFGKIMLATCKTIELDETTVHQKAQQLIPLIKIEQVTIKLNSDHVTQ